MPRFDFAEAELRAYRPDVARPQDFDDFWNASVSDARGVSRDVARAPVDMAMRAVRVDDVTFSGFAGDPISAWLVLPAGAAEPLPAVVEFVGYGRGRGLPMERLAWPAAGFAQLIVDVRGQGSTWGTGGATADPHGSAPAAAGFLTRGILDPATYYYRRVFVDAVRAVDAMAGFPEIDAARIAVVGNSQGGTIAIAAAGIHESVAAALPTAPILCDVRRAIGLTDADPHAEITRYLSVHRGEEDRVFATLGYVDGVNFARRAAMPAHFGAGHMDMISPPSTVYAAANSWHGGAEIIGYPWNGHEGGEGLHWLAQVAWLREKFGMTS